MKVWFKLCKPPVGVRCALVSKKKRKRPEMSWPKDAKSDKVIQFETQLDLYLEVASSLFMGSLKPFKRSQRINELYLCTIEH